MNFTAIDFETANSSYISACSVGVSVFENNKPVKQYSKLIKPPKEAGDFNWYNIKIHGIKKSDVKNEPNFSQIWNDISQDIENKIIVCHNAVFDTSVLRKCLEFYQIPCPSFKYICTVKVAQKLWPELENHKLDTVSKSLNISLNHHEAGSDAHACGLILQNALNQTGCTSINKLANMLGIRLGYVSNGEHISCSCAKNALQ